MWIRTCRLHQALLAVRLKVPLLLSPGLCTANRLGGLQPRKDRCQTQFCLLDKRSIHLTPLTRSLPRLLPHHYLNGLRPSNYPRLPRNMLHHKVPKQPLESLLRHRIIEQVIRSLMTIEDSLLRVDSIFTISTKWCLQWASKKSCLPHWASISPQET